MNTFFDSLPDWLTYTLILVLIAVAIGILCFTIIFIYGIIHLCVRNLKYKPMREKTITVTAEMIAQGLENLYDPEKCIGAVALRAAFPEGNSIFWGLCEGQYSISDKRILVTSFFANDEDKGFRANMMELKKPTLITFKQRYEND